jgi:hypothetical protein
MCGLWCDRELNKALLLNGTFMKLRKLKKLMRKFDEDGSGSLSFEVTSNKQQAISNTVSRDYYYLMDIVILLCVCD